jgi:hypothetical protein
MATIVDTLFGVSPERLEQQRAAAADARALAFAQLDPFQQANFAIGRGASGLAGALGGALGGQDPELQRVTMRQQIARQINPSDPATIQQGIAALQQAGDTEGAMLLNSEFRKIQESAAKIKKDEAAAAASGREQAPKPYVVGNALVSAEGVELYKGPAPEKYSTFAQELIDAGLTPGTEPFQKRMLEYVGSKAKGAAKGTGNVTIGGITVDTGAAAKAAGTIVGQGVANIENQYSLLTAFNDAVTLVNDGIYGGAYGPEQAAATKFSLGLLGDKKKLENTEVFLANIGEIVIPRLQQFGGNDSNEELKYLQKVVAGDQRLEPGAVKRILASAEKKVRNNIKRLQDQAKSGETGEQLPTGPLPPSDSTAGNALSAAEQAELEALRLRFRRTP